MITSLKIATESLISLILKKDNAQSIQDFVFNLKFSKINKNGHMILTN